MYLILFLLKIYQETITINLGASLY